jgi:hypothetical protein
MAGNPRRSKSWAAGIWAEFQPNRPILKKMQNPCFFLVVFGRLDTKAAHEDAKAPPQ